MSGKKWFDEHQVLSPGQWRYLDWSADILIYTVVLGLFVEYSENVTIDSFTIAALTAILLKVMLTAILGLEHRIAGFFDRWEGRAIAVLKVAVMWGILFGSKFVILESVDIVFGEHVTISGFVPFILLVIAMTVTRAASDAVFRRL